MRTNSDEQEESSLVTITLHCPCCGSEALVCDGHAPNGKQKYRCHACGHRSRENPTPNVSPEARRMPKEPSRSGVCRWGSQQTDVPALVGGHSTAVSPGPVQDATF